MPNLTTKPTPLPDIVSDSKLETFFGSDYVEHTYYTHDVWPDGPVTRSANTERWMVDGENAFLGEGAHGKVVRQRCGQRLRAVKELKKTTKPGKELEIRRELEAIAKFSCPKFSEWFVASYGWYELGTSVFIAMEYLPYGDLCQQLATPLPEAQAQVIIKQVLEGLQHMHSNRFIHRDLKPGNILVLRPAPSWKVKIADFGISKRRQEDRTSDHTANKGTLGYAAPEVFGYQANKLADIKRPPGEYALDLWSIGAITFRIMTNRVPFGTQADLMEYAFGQQAFPKDPLLNGATADFIQKLMLPNPLNRLQVREALDHGWMQSHTQSQNTVGSRRNGRHHDRVEEPSQASDDAFCGHYKGHTVRPDTSNIIRPDKSAAHRIVVDESPEVRTREPWKFANDNTPYSTRPGDLTQGHSAQRMEKRSQEPVKDSVPDFMKMPTEEPIKDWFTFKAPSKDERGRHSSIATEQCVGKRPTSLSRDGRFSRRGPGSPPPHATSQPAYDAVTGGIPRMVRRQGVQQQSPVSRDRSSQYNHGAGTRAVPPSSLQQYAECGSRGRLDSAISRFGKAPARRHPDVYRYSSSSSSGESSIGGHRGTVAPDRRTLHRSSMSRERVPSTSDFVTERLPMASTYSRGISDSVDEYTRRFERLPRLKRFRSFERSDFERDYVGGGVRRSISPNLKERSRSVLSAEGSRRRSSRPFNSLHGLYQIVNALLREPAEPSEFALSRKEDLPRRSMSSDSLYGSHLDSSIFHQPKQKLSFGVLTIRQLLRMVSFGKFPKRPERPSSPRRPIERRQMHKPSTSYVPKEFQGFDTTACASDAFGRPPPPPAPIVIDELRAPVPLITKRKSTPIREGNAMQRARAMAASRAHKSVEEWLTSQSRIEVSRYHHVPPSPPPTTRGSDAPPPRTPVEALPTPGGIGRINKQPQTLYDWVSPESARHHPELHAIPERPRQAPDPLKNNMSAKATLDAGNPRITEILTPPPEALRQSHRTRRHRRRVERANPRHNANTHDE